MKRAITCAALFFCAMAASAFDGNELLSSLNGDDAFNKGFAFGFMQSTIDTSDRMRAYCPPKDTIYSQAFDVVRLHLQNNPKDRGKSAEFLIVKSLKEAWPCPQKK